MIKKLRALAQPGLLAIAGLGCIATAAWMWYRPHLWPGLAATGIVLIVLEWRFEK